MAHSMDGLDDRHTLFNIRDSVSYSGLIFFADGYYVAYLLLSIMHINQQILFITCILGS
jgi:hypothetical protein